MQNKMIVYNPKNGSEIKDFRWEGGAWKLEVNKMSKFPELVAKELLKRYGFLIEVKAEDVTKILKIMTAKMIPCPHCEQEFESEAKLKGHILGKHKVTEESKKILDSIPEAEVIVSKKAVNQTATKKLSIEEQEGILGDGWVGGGLEDDSGSSDISIKRPGDSGNF